MKTEQVINELKDLIENYSHSIPYEDDKSQTYQAIETNDVLKIIDKLEKFKTLESQKIKSQNWLIKNHNLICIREVERRLGMPDSTLSKVVNGNRGIPENWVEPVVGFIAEFNKGV
tara:strand:- start:1095 stop:1442 length:348 start_codon:yes stop_codon:yes gene_type:complete